MNLCELRIFMVAFLNVLKRKNKTKNNVERIKIICCISLEVRVPAQVDRNSSGRRITDYQIAHFQTM